MYQLSNVSRGLRVAPFTGKDARMSDQTLFGKIGTWFKRGSGSGAIRMGREPSFRVLEKCGFHRDHTTIDEKGELVWLVREVS